MSATHTLHVYAGRDFAFAAQWVDSAGQPHSLATAEITAQIRARYPDAAGDPPPLAEFTTSGDAQGVFHLTLTGEQTTDLEPGAYLYDVLVVTGTGARPPLLRGSVVVHPAVTVIEDES